MYGVLLLCAAIGSGQPQATQAPVTLQRTFTLGQKSKYHVEATIENATRRPASGLQTFLPSETILSYDFFTRVKKVEAGNATMSYYRPYMIETDDNGQPTGPSTIKVKLEMMADLTLSPINAMLDVKQTGSSKKPEIEQIPTPNSFAAPLAATARKQGGDLIGGFIQQMQQLAVFIGGPQSSLDFKPDLGLTPVSVGDTWKRTVGYEPQRLGGDKGKTQVMRLDITYTYKGSTTYQGKPVLEVDGEIHLDSDVVNYLKDQFKVTSSQTNIKSIPLKLDESLVFYLDPKSMQTIYAKVSSTGGYTITATVAAAPIVETKITGSAEMTLVSNTIVK